MGKHGPCRHCGVTSTPLWRNGPPEKPVLCNACGSRWRTKGSLTNYTPLHSREALESEDYKISKVRTISFKPKELKAHKKRLSIDMSEIEQDIPCSGQNFRKIFEGDTSNRSSSGSAISYSESCAHFGVPDASDMTGSAQSNAWDPLVPSKKRSGVTRPKPSSVEKLTRDLHSIMHEQQSSYFSVSSEEDLLYESGTPMGVEIGHGGVLIRYIDSKTVDEESEASSLPIDNKSYITSEVYSGSASCLVHSESKEISDSNVGIEKLKKSAVAQEHVKRDKVSNGKIDILRDRDSPLSFIDLKDEKHEEIIEGKKIGTRSNFLEHSRLTSLKRHRDNQNQHNQESKGGAMRSPKRVMRPWKLNSIDASSKLVPDADDSVENEGACFSPRSIFASPPDRSSMLVSLQYTDESSDQDLLLDAPCNSSFPEAQLLFHPWNGTVQNSSLAESGVAEAGEESLSNHPSSSFSSQRHR